MKRCDIIFLMETRINTVWYPDQKPLEIATEHAVIRLGIG